MVLGAVLAWGPIDAVSITVGLVVLVVGGLMVAVTAGIRMLGTEPGS